MELIKTCLDSLKYEKQQEENDLNNLVSLIESNENFNYFVKKIPFNDFMSMYASECSENIPIDSNDLLLKALADSITDYQVIDLIAKNLINNYK